MSWKIQSSKGNQNLTVLIDADSSRTVTVTPKHSETLTDYEYASVKTYIDRNNYLSATEVLDQDISTTNEVKKALEIELGALHPTVKKFIPEATRKKMPAFLLYIERKYTALIDDKTNTLWRYIKKIIEPYILKTSGEHTTVGGGVSEDITVAGITASNKVVVGFKSMGTTPVAWVSGECGDGIVTLTFPADPADDHVVSYIVT